MKFSFFKNDKSTVMDEVYLALFILAFLVPGVLLCVYRPTFWIVATNDSFMFGFLLVFIAVMFIPGLIYRLFTNDKKDSKKTS